jgi:hypothetical protein
MSTREAEVAAKLKEVEARFIDEQNPYNASGQLVNGPDGPVFEPFDQDPVTGKFVVPEKLPKKTRSAPKKEEDS